MQSYSTKPFGLRLPDDLRERVDVIRELAERQSNLGARVTLNGTIMMLIQRGVEQVERENKRKIKKR